MTGSTDGLHCDTTSAWVVDDVSSQAKEAARVGAERAGLSLGQWLQAVILEAAAHQPLRSGTRTVEDPRPERRYF